MICKTLPVLNLKRQPLQIILVLLAYGEKFLSTGGLVLTWFSIAVIHLEKTLEERND